MKLCILADGMGGYKGGEIASSLATASARHYIEENFDRIELTTENIQKLIKDAMDYANKIVYKKSKENEELEQMGTTLEICIMYGNKVYMGHIADSRIYRIRKNIIRRKNGSGTWTFNEFLDRCDISQSIEFSCDGTSYNQIAMHKLQDENMYVIAYDNTGTYQYFEAWVNTTYQNIDFGSTPQEVSQEFYDWFTANVTKN